MYYDNKRTFYVKQYGPTVAVSIVAVVLISVGTLFYFKTNSSENNIADSKPDEEVIDVAVDNVNENTIVKQEEKVEPEKQEPQEELKVEETLPKEELETEEETSALQEIEIVPYFSKLQKLVISEQVNVTAVDDKGNISLEYKGDKLTVAMIGVNYTYSTQATYDKIKADLEGQKVRIAFDAEKESAGITYAYIYLDDQLYNADLLRSGLATLKSERTNVALATDLSKAQADARDNKLGVWNR